MRKVDVLRTLQQVDLDADRRQERLTSIRVQLEDREELDRLWGERDQLRNRLRRLETDQSDLELEVENLRSKVQQIERKLYGGTVKSPKELENLAKEAQQIGQTINSREDRLLDYMEQIEQTTSALRSVESQLERDERAWQDAHRLLEDEQTQLEAEVTELERKRVELRASLDPQSVRLYDSLRRGRGGFAVVEVRQRTCQGCRVSLPISEEMRARSSPDLVTCQSCSRILFASV